MRNNPAKVLLWHTSELPQLVARIRQNLVQPFRIQILTHNEGVIIKQKPRETVTALEPKGIFDQFPIEAGRVPIVVTVDVDELNGEGILERDGDSERGSEENLVGAPDEGGEVGGEGLVGLGTAVEGSEGVELAARDDAVTGDGGAVVDGAGAEVDPEVAMGGCEEGAGAFGDSGRGFGAGGVGVGVGFGVGVGIGGEVEEVEVNVGLGGVRVVFEEVVLDDLVDGGVRDMEEGGAEGGGGGEEGLGEEGCEGGRGGGGGGCGVEVEGVGEGESVRERREGGDEVEVGGGGGGKEGREEGGGVGREVAHQ
ncbi:hypothetical protein CR513_56665, partial [Mucuna pruriens]